jgi:5'-nucleotidase
MSNDQKPQILLTNDDGIRSDGLWAAAEALSEIGFVTVAAPRDQYSGAGRSMPFGSDGVLREEEVTIHGVTWKVYAVGGSPAQAVQHGVLELTSTKPDLVVAGINHGENLTVDIAISGTVGAALEAAAFGIPSIAVSLEMPKEKQYEGSDSDFSAAAHYTAHFGKILLEGETFPDVDVIKIDVPTSATPKTPWRLTRLSRYQYYVPLRPEREHLEQEVQLDFEIRFEEDELEPDSDVYAVRVAREVSVTPVSLDMTSRVDFGELERQLRSSDSRV